MREIEKERDLLVLLSVSVVFVQVSVISNASLTMEEFVYVLVHKSAC